MVLQPDVCNGCGYCVPACPFGVVDRDPEDGRAGKCTLCYDRLEDGLEPACAKSCPTDSIQFGPHEELVEIASRRVAQLHERGIEGAYLYGAGDYLSGEQLAGGLGSFFLLTEPPERYGLPAHADSPVQENVVPATLAAVAGGLLAAAGAVLAFTAARRRGRRTTARALVNTEHRWDGSLEQAGKATDLAPEHEPPDTTGGRATEWVADHDTDTRDIQPALGTRGEPGPWTATEPGAPIALARPDFGDAQWSYLYKARDTDYANAQPAPGQIAAANRRMRSAPISDIHGPFSIHAPLWGWVVATYFWFGGMASGSAFVSLACDTAGDHRSAAIARKVALGAVAPAPLLLIADLGRPERFLNMVRISSPARR